MNTIAFQHRMAAHCETGTICALLQHAGLEITEPMIFGVAGGIFFGYFKGQQFTFPTFIVRTKPGDIRKRIKKVLGVKFKTYNFSNPKKAEEELNRLLDQNIPVAVQVDFFYMDYMPAWQRVHINVHFITIIGRKENKYIVSDAYFPRIAEIDRETLSKARFAGGSFAPKGFMYYVESVPNHIDYFKVIRKGLKKAVFNMLKIPIPFLGVKGIVTFSKKINEWPKLARNEEHLSHEIMKINILLEDQGTGGAGFRFMFATFLRQASELLRNDDLLDLSKRMMEIGDGWREISLFAVRIGKKRDLGSERIKELSGLIMNRAIVEKAFFLELKNVLKKIK